MIRQVIKETYVPREILDWTQETEKKAKEFKSLLEYMIDNVEDYPQMKREPEIRHAVSTIRKAVDSMTGLEKALQVLYDYFVYESRK